MKNSKTPTTSHPFLSLTGLPSSLASLSTGSLYGLVADSQSIRVAVAAQSICASASLASPSTWVTTHDPVSLVKKASHFAPSLEKLLAKHKARMLRMEADVGKRLLRYGSAKLIEDLKAQDVKNGSLLVIEQANKVLGLSDIATASVTSQLFQIWAEQQSLTIVFLFNQDPEHPREYANLKQIADAWAGLAVIKSYSQKASIAFKHWYGRQGTTPGGRFALGLTSEGQLGVTLANGKSEEEATTISPNHEDQGIIATSMAVAGLDDLGPRVRFCDDPLELLDFTRRAKGGTVLLHFAHRSELDRLAKLVANLRSIAAPQVRIVVRECGAKLRKGDNYALLQLGASFIIPQDIPAEAARVLIDQIGSAALKRNHNPKAVEQLRALLADSSGRLLSPYEFKLRVGNLLDLSDASLVHSLVILKAPVAGLATRIANLIGPRVRDVIFSDLDGRLLLFLFGCNAQAAQVVMDRLFVTRKESSSAWHCISTQEEIRAHLSRLEHVQNTSTPTALSRPVMVQSLRNSARRTA